jgi:hypothetical protein
MIGLVALRDSLNFPVLHSRLIRMQECTRDQTTAPMVC